ncbi:basic salivary proline-rich protein 4-like [Panthera pardus]|uniref:Basic salivary proline-rich protein 4-like n=1 Tax=Panthera pardus TaxID=9691 RepID=A0A9W2UPW0_PANPR|nr:basic salivary proline-rich protein 4-like [Panthera pardus]
MGTVNRGKEAGVCSRGAARTKRDDKEPGSQRGVPPIFSSPSVPTTRPRQKAQDCAYSFGLICLKTCAREASGARQTPPPPPPTFPATSDSSRGTEASRLTSLLGRGAIWAPEPFLESRGSRPEPGAFSSRPNSGGHARSGAAPSARARGKGTNPHCIFPPSPPGRETPRRGHSGPHAARRKPRFLPAGSSRGPPRRAGSAAAPPPPGPCAPPLSLAGLSSASHSRGGGDIHQPPPTPTAGLRPPSPQGRAAARRGRDALRLWRPRG